MKYFIILGLIISLAACQEDKTLPILGNTAQEDGKTIYHHVRDWSYMRQDSVVVTNDSLKPYIYITDFFFTSCPSICPKVTKEMLKVYDAYKNKEIDICIAMRLHSIILSHVYEIPFVWVSYSTKTDEVLNELKK